MVYTGGGVKGGGVNIAYGRSSPVEPYACL